MPALKTLKSTPLRDEKHEDYVKLFTEVKDIVEGEKQLMNNLSEHIEKGI